MTGDPIVSSQRAIKFWSDYRLAKGLSFGGRVCVSGSRKLQAKALASFSDKEKSRREKQLLLSTTPSYSPLSLYFLFVVTVRFQGSIVFPFFPV